MEAASGAAVAVAADAKALAIAAAMSRALKAIRGLLEQLGCGRGGSARPHLCVRAYYVRMGVRAYASMYVRAYARMYVCVRMCVRMDGCVRMDVRMRLGACLCTCLRACVYVCEHVADEAGPTARQRLCAQDGAGKLKLPPEMASAGNTTDSDVERGGYCSTSMPPPN